MKACPRALPTCSARRPDTSALEELVRSLSDKIERAVAPQADHHAIEALEEQITLLAQRMEASNPALSLNALERTIGALFGEFERTRTVSLEAAEQSARNAVHEALTGSEHTAERGKDRGRTGRTARQAGAGRQAHIIDLERRPRNAGKGRRASLDIRDRIDRASRHVRRFTAAAI